MVVLVVAFFPRPTQGAQFVVSSWSYPDSYGQGIYNVSFYENSTGSWVLIDTLVSANSTTIEYNYTADTAIRVVPVFTLNHTYFGFTAGEIEQAGTVSRNSIEVSLTGTSVYSEGFTFGSWGNQSASVWWISYYTVVNVIIASGATYVVVIEFEVYM